ncbi:low affinity iron permease family protein [soil metagenome]
MHNVFTKLAKRAAEWVGSQWAFAIAVSVILLWGITGPLFKFSDTWQLVINTSTTIITFLMVFLIQNTQNRDAKAIHLKLDELIRTNEKARNALIDLEDVTDDVLKKLEGEFKEMHDEDGARGTDDVLDAIKEERDRRA